MHMSFRQYLATVATLFALICSNGCDSNNNNKNPAPVSSSSSSQSSSLLNPATAEEFGKVQIQFPPNGSRVNNAQITVRGSVLESDDVTSLAVNGNLIDMADLADWQIEIPLDFGVNTILVEATLNDASTLNQTLTLHREAILTTATDFAVDKATDNLYAIDATQNTLFAIDKDSQAATVLSPALDSTTPNLLENPTCMVIDSTNNRILVAQRSTNPLIAVDLTSGAQTILNATGSENYALLNRPSAMTLIGQDLYISDQEEVDIDAENVRISDPDETPDHSLEAVIIYRINLATMTFSSVYKYETGLTKILAPTVSMTRNLSADKLYLTDIFSSTTRVYGINPATGEINFITIKDASGADYAFSGPIDLTYDTGSENLLLSASNGIYRLNPVTGVEILLSSSLYPENQTIDFVNIRQISTNGADDAIIVFDDAKDLFITVDKTIGKRELLGNNTTLRDNYVAVIDIVFDQYNQQLFLLDSAAGSIFASNLATQEKTRIASKQDYPTLASTSKPVLFPSQGFINGFGELIVFDSLTSTYSRIVRVHKNEDNTYTPTILKSLNAGIVDVTYDLSSDTAYLAAFFYVNSQFTNFVSQLVIDQNGYQVENFSTNNTNNADAPFATIRGLALDQDNDRVLVADSGANALIAVDLVTAKREYFSGYTTSAENNDAVELDQPRQIVVHTSTQKAFVVDDSKSTIITVDLSDGSKSLWLDYSELAHLGLSSPKALEIHPFFHYLWIFDEQSHQLLAVDIATKQVVTLSR